MVQQPNHQRLLWRMGAPFAMVALARTTMGSPAFEAGFDGGSLSPFVLSSNERYAGQKVEVTEDGGMVLKAANHFYGIGAAVTPPYEGTSFTAQFEVTLTDGLSCGGAYVKLLESTESLDASTFDDKTPFVVMFGPDKCGGTDKVHVIVRQKNQVSGEWFEHHLVGGPKPLTDKKTHLYTLRVKEDDGVEVLIDGKSKFTGNLMDSFDPPLTPPTEIDDPEDSKPDDWVDEAKIPDPDATKPDDWDEDAPRKITDPDASKPSGWVDDAPLQIPDPTASRPDDWDDEEDGLWEAPEVANPVCKVGCGEWVAPLIDNPAYKGKWSAPLIDNPAYKGQWAPRKIANPNYFEVKNPAANMPKIGAFVVDVWTTNSGIVYDNFVLTSDPKDAERVAQKFHAKKAVEEAEEKAKKDAKKQRKLEKKLAKGTLSAKIQLAYSKVLEQAIEQPLATAGSAVALIGTLIYVVFVVGGLKKNKTPSPSAASESASADATPAGGADDQDADQAEQVHQKPPMDDE